MFKHHMINRYMLVRKRTLLMAGLAAAGLMGYRYYKHHHNGAKENMDRITDDVTSAKS